MTEWNVSSELVSGICMRSGTFDLDDVSPETSGTFGTLYYDIFTNTYITYHLVRDC